MTGKGRPKGCPPTGGSWKPGQVTNPAGRPKIAATIKELCRELTPECIETLRACLPVEGERIPAVTLILAYGYGRPVQTQNVRVIRGMADLTEEELIALAEDAESQREGERLH